MKRYVLHIAISAVALVLATCHLIFPAATIDSICLALLAIAILPWLGSIFSKVELPGGLKVEYKDLEKAKEEAEKVGLLEKPLSPRDLPIFVTIAAQDPNLALAGLRIEIEKRLRMLAQERGIRSERLSIGPLMRSLHENQAISQSEVSVLRDMIGLLNDAVHGAKVDARAAEWAIDVGPQLLAALDKRVGLPSK